MEIYNCKVNFCYLGLLLLSLDKSQIYNPRDKLNINCLCWPGDNISKSLSRDCKIDF